MVGFDVVDGPNSFWLKRDDLLLFLDYIPNPVYYKDPNKVLCFLYDNKKIWRSEW